MIGVTSDYQPVGGLCGTLSDIRFPRYQLRCAYMQALYKAGAKGAMGLGCIKQFIPYYVDSLDGLVITGGDFDVNPARYNAPQHPKTVLNPARHDFEWELLDSFIKTGKPILGVCAGMQLLNVYHGGSLIQHVPDNQDLLDHMGKADQQLHEVTVSDNTLLSAIVGDSRKLHVNSVHHQAIERVGEGLTINAISDDGIVEGIENSRYDFVMGVQWHPEFLLVPEELKIWQAFITATQKYKK